LGPVAFGSAAVNIKAWTYEPNGVVDPIAGDDTLNQDYMAALTGLYTIGGVNPNFPSVVAAATALNKFGTCGDVVFDVRPGVYTGQVVFNNPLPANSSINHVTFRAENGNANSETITHNTSNTDYPVIIMNATSNFTFKNLTVTTAAAYGHCFAMNFKSANDSIVGCILNAPANTNSTSNAAVYGYNTTSYFSGDNLVIKDNIINGGYYSLYLYG